jgi:hypothetical protein
MTILLCVSLEHVDKDVWDAVQRNLCEVMSNLIRTANIDDESLPYPSEPSTDLENSSNIPRWKESLVTGFSMVVYDGLSVPASDHPVTTLFGKVINSIGV